MFIHVFFCPNTIQVGFIITYTWQHILAHLFSCCLIKYNIIFPTIFFWLELILWSSRFVCVLCYTWQHIFICPKGQFKQIMVNYILNQGWFCLFVKNNFPLKTRHTVLFFQKGKTLAASGSWTDGKTAGGRRQPEIMFYVVAEWTTYFLYWNFPSKKRIIRFM